MRVFGSLVVEEGDRKLVSFPTVRCVEMLGYLFLRPGEFVSRGTLIETLWPQVSEKAGRNRVSVTLHSCKKSFAAVGLDFDRFILVDRQNMSARVQGVTNEWTEFWSALHAARGAESAEDKEEAYNRVLGQFRGRVLSDLKGDWIDKARADSVVAYNEAAIYLAERAESQGQALKGRTLRERAITDYDSI